MAESADELTSVHEALVELLERMPAERLLPIICPLVGLHPGEIAELRQLRGSASLLRLPRKTKRGYPDLLVELRTHAGERVRVVIVEVQLSLDATKAKTWQLMQSNFETRYMLDTRLLLLTPDPDLRAKISDRVLSKLPARLHDPLFIGADQIPFIRDYTQARSRPLETILGAVFHSLEPDTPKRGQAHKIDALCAAFIALEVFDSTTAFDFQAIIMSIAPSKLIPTVILKVIEEGEVPKSRFDKFSDLERGGYSFNRGREEGRKEGLRTMLARIIEREYGAPTQSQQALIDTANTERLMHYIERALSATTLDELLSSASP